MKSYDLRMDVSGSLELPGPLATAVTVHLPDRMPDALTVLFGFPGGAYTRGYYDIDLLPGYSQAEFHTAQGHAFVACDHIGIGDSTPVDPFELTIEQMALANHITVTRVLDGLRAGTLIDGIAPVAPGPVIGMGQSMGGCLLTVQQGRHNTFDAIAVLGFGVVASSFVIPGGERISFPAVPRDADLRAGAQDMLRDVASHAAMLRHSFHSADADPQLLAAEMANGADTPLPPWRCPSAPPCAAKMMTPGSVLPEARQISVPVLLGSGEIDLVTDPWLEPTAFRNSRDVSVFVVPRMAHMHNFARTRVQLWERIALFVDGICADPERREGRP